MRKVVVSMKEFVLKSVRPVLMNLEKIKEQNDAVVYRELYDLGVIYQSSIQGNTVTVTRHDMEQYGITMEELHQHAMNNMFNDKPKILMFGEKKSRNEVTVDFPMVIITNCESYRGAAMILHPKVKELVAGLIGNQFYVIPSSVNETIAVPAEVIPNVIKLLDIVYEMNRKAITEIERLSDSVYFCDAAGDTFSMISAEWGYM